MVSSDASNAAVVARLRLRAFRRLTRLAANCCALSRATRVAARLATRPSRSAPRVCDRRACASSTSRSSVAAQVDLTSSTQNVVGETMRGFKRYRIVPGDGASFGVASLEVCPTRARAHRRATSALSSNASNNRSLWST